MAFVIGGGERKVKGSEITAHVAADSIVAFCHKHGDLITNDRLQKLLYYAQGWHLALKGSPLFPDEFQAWINGPIQPETYKAYSLFQHRPIDQPRGQWRLPAASDKHIENVFEAYGRLSAFDLERLSCSEAPWIAARAGLAPDEPSNSVIDKQQMAAFFKSRLDEKQK